MLASLRFALTLTPTEGAKMIAEYQAQSARDAQERGYGGQTYWDYLEEAALRTQAYFLARGDEEQAALMLTRTLGEALAGNDGG